MKTRKTTYLFAVGATLLAVLLLIWLSLGVGIIGADGDPANRMYLGVIAIGVVGAVIARFQAHGMSGVLIVMAVVQASIAVIAIAAKLGFPFSGPLELALLNGFFAALFAGAAWLFRRAAQ